LAVGVDISQYAELSRLPLNQFKLVFRAGTKNPFGGKERKKEEGSHIGSMSQAEAKPSLPTASSVCVQF
jgi:hypothetical protein